MPAFNDLYAVFYTLQKHFLGNYFNGFGTWNNFHMTFLSTSGAS